METRVNVDKNTIERFGIQWTSFTENTGYYGSKDCLSDIFGPLLTLEDIKGKHICDVGSGTGRIVNMLLDAGADFVTALEPSEAFKTLEKNTIQRKDKIQLIQDTGDKIPSTGQFDYVISLGVLHHILDPTPTVQAAFNALKPGGKILIWIYGFEGNKLYLSIFGPLRKLTARLPHSILSCLSGFLGYFVDFYIFLCRFLPLPMRNYFQNHLAKLDREQRKITIYDQLNPTHAKYYKKQEVENLLREQGFQKVRLYHRHGYSWTALGEKKA